MSKKDLGDVSSLLGDLVGEVPLIGICVIAGLGAGLAVAIVIKISMGDELPLFVFRFLLVGLLLGCGFLGLIVGGVVELAAERIRSQQKTRRKRRSRRTLRDAP